MSVCRKLPDGTIQKIAGHTILLDANASEVRQGTWNISMPATPSTYQTTVTFTDPMPDTDYAVILEMSDYTYGGTVNVQLMVFDKTVTGFKIKTHISPSSSGAISGVYTAFKPIKLEGYTELQNKVNNPDASPTEDSLNLVTSGGVYEAIKNASAVWKGTKAEWNALPAAEKQTYDLAVLLDTTLVKAVDREDGTETDVANLNKIVPMTQAEYDAMPSHDPDTYYMITDDTTVMSPSYPCPDWNNAVDITLAQALAGYSCPDYGQLLITIGFSGPECNIVVTVNDKIILRWYHPGGGTAQSRFNSVVCPVAKGDVMKFSSIANISVTTTTFVPWK